MRCASLLLLLAAPAFAGAINTEAALTEGVGQVVSRTKLRYADLENEVERYLAQQTVLYGALPRLSLFGTLGHVWHSPGEDGLTDLVLKGRYKLFWRDAKRETLTFSGIAALEIPIGEEPIGSPDGGLLIGLVGTFERNDWRIDADVQHSFRPDVRDFLRADFAVSRNFAIRARDFWIGVLELNYRRSGDADVLFLAPGIVYEMVGWKFELSFQTAIFENARGPVEEHAAVFAVVHAF